MPLNSKIRDEKDIDLILWYIKSDLNSIHPSNDSVRILLQYFQPLFDLTLGIAVSVNNEIIASNYLTSENKDALQSNFNESLKNQLLWSNYAESDIYKNLRQAKLPYIDEAKSILIIPIEKCFRESIKALFILFSRLTKEDFTMASNDPLNYIVDYLKDST